jgi:hypothetical protein
MARTTSGNPQKSRDARVSGGFVATNSALLRTSLCEIFRRKARDEASHENLSTQGSPAERVLRIEGRSCQGTPVGRKVALVDRCAQRRNRVDIDCWPDAHASNPTRAPHGDAPERRKRRWPSRHHRGRLSLLDRPGVEAACRQILQRDRQHLRRLRWSNRFRGRKSSNDTGRQIAESGPGRAHPTQGSGQPWSLLASEERYESSPVEDSLREMLHEIVRDEIRPLREELRDAIDATRRPTVPIRLPIRLPIRRPS